MSASVFTTNVKQFKSETDEPIIMVRLERKEALELIASMAEQMRSGNPNTNRAEIYIQGSDQRVYFSVAVHDLITT